MNALSAPVGLAPVGLRRLPGHVSSRADDPGAQTGPRGVFQAVIPRPASRAKLSECAALCLAGALALQARQISRRQRRMAKSRHRAARVLRQEGASDHDGTLEPGNSALPEEWMQQTDFWNGLWGGPEDRWDDIIEEAGVGDVLAKKKVTVMISDTGGGHRASAKAIADALHELYPDQVCPLKKGDDNVDYWEGDLMYASSASGAANYSTKADKVLEKPQEFMALYEKCYQLRRSELHFIIKRLPQWILTQGFFLGGTSEGAMTVARFDDQRYGEQIIGRFINSFGIEYCYFTPTPNDGKIGGQLDVPTLNIIGTKDQYFGAIDSVAKIVANDPTNGYGEKDLTGNGYKTMVAQKLNVGLVCVLEEGVHSPCNTHDNFLRQLFQHFFTRAASIWELDQIWSGDPTLKGLVEVKQSTTNEDAFTGCNIKQLFVPTMPFPNRMSLREVQALRCIKRGGDVLATAMREEGEIIKKEKAAITAKLDAVRAGSSRNGGKGFQQTTSQRNFYHGDAQREVKNHK
ncbi:unnamed protein product [Polarella glacialis]|uniref:Monogalactosyldiacylglycerol synthase n=1 Tax=Polarella glacialis TaxID=89957 RepID=A0A813G5T5_POLGL|nr:unnamed protein product [Polarella glacialis]